MAASIYGCLYIWLPVYTAASVCGRLYYCLYVWLDLRLAASIDGGDTRLLLLVALYRSIDLSMYIFKYMYTYISLYIHQLYTSSLPSVRVADAHVHVCMYVSLCGYIDI